MNHLIKAQLDFWQQCKEAKHCDLTTEALWNQYYFYHLDEIGFTGMSTSYIEALVTDYMNEIPKADWSCDTVYIYGVEYTIDDRSQGSD